jgi:hypothetical protein
MGDEFQFCKVKGVLGMGGGGGGAQHSNCVLPNVKAASLYAHSKMSCF